MKITVVVVVVVRFCVGINSHGRLSEEHETVMVVGSWYL